MTPQDKARSPTSSSTEEVRALQVKAKPLVGVHRRQRASPPQSSLRDDSSSIEEERGAKAWLRRRARQLWKATTPHEKGMWQLLHQGELSALNWRRQAPFGDYVLDFVSHPARIVVEVDGSQHAQTEIAAADAARTEHLEGEGYKVLRFWNQNVLTASDGVWRTIQAAAAVTPARVRIQRWRDYHLAQVAKQNAQITSSSSMEEVAAKRPEEVRALQVKAKPLVGAHRRQRASPPQSSLRDDSSSIEEERK